MVDKNKIAEIKEAIKSKKPEEFKKYCAEQKIDYDNLEEFNTKLSKRGFWTKVGDFFRKMIGRPTSTDTILKDLQDTTIKPAINSGYGNNSSIYDQVSDIGEATSRQPSKKQQQQELVKIFKTLKQKIKEITKQEKLYNSDYVKKIEDIIKTAREMQKKTKIFHKAYRNSTKNTPRILKLTSNIIKQYTELLKNIKVVQKSNELKKIIDENRKLIKQRKQSSQERIDQFKIKRQNLQDQRKQRKTRIAQHKSALLNR